MKKYTLEIYFKQTNELINSHKTNNLKYINKILYKFFYSTLDIPTTKLLDYEYIITENDTNKTFKNYWPDKWEIEKNKIMNR